MEASRRMALARIDRPMSGGQSVTASSTRASASCWVQAYRITGSGGTGRLPAQLPADGGRVFTLRLRLGTHAHGRSGDSRITEWFEALALRLGAIMVLMALGMPVALAFPAANVIGAWVFMGGGPGIGRSLLVAFPQLALWLPGL
nr:hypothetical protein [Sedimentitalea xiamensis]